MMMLENRAEDTAEPPDPEFRPGTVCRIHCTTADMSLTCSTHACEYLETKLPEQNHGSCHRDLQLLVYCHIFLHSDSGSTCMMETDSLPLGQHESRLAGNDERRLKPRQRVVAGEVSSFSSVSQRATLTSLEADTQRRAPV